MKIFTVWRPGALSILIAAVSLFVACSTGSTNGSLQTPEDATFVRFDTIKIDSIVPLLDTSERPSLSLKVNVECPVEAATEELLQSAGFMSVSLLEDGTYLSDANWDLRRVVDLCLENHIGEYRREGMRELENYSDDPEGAAIWLNYEYSLSGVCLFNQDSILCYGLSAFSYNGGAHGYGTTSYGVMDKVSCMPVHLVDFITEENEAEVTALLKQAIADSFKYVSYEELKKEHILFDADALALTENFFVDLDGVTWHFDPYELAPYVYGDIEATVSWDKLQPYLPENCALCRIASRSMKANPDPNPAQ